jgi:hypothetical protein
VAHPLSARLVLLAAAAALAASLVFAMIVAEHRDLDGRAKGSAAAPLRLDGARPAPVERLGSVRVAARRP